MAKPFAGTAELERSVEKGVSRPEAEAENRARSLRTTLRRKRLAERDRRAIFSRICLQAWPRRGYSYLRALAGAAGSAGRTVSTATDCCLHIVW